MNTIIRKLMSRASLAALSLGLYITSVAHADSYDVSATSYSISNSASGTLILPQFDSSLGTLTGVTIKEVVVLNSGSATVTGPSSGTATVYNAYLNVKATIAAANGLSAFSVTTGDNFISSDTSFSSGASKTYDLTGSENSVTKTVGSSYLNAYIGSGYVYFNYAVLTSFLASSTGGATFSSTTDSAVELYVTYTYDATSAIPEPSTYAAIFGVATLGFVTLSRRRQANA